MVASSARDGLARAAVLGLLVAVALAVVGFGVAGRADAITLTQAEAPLPVQTADPHVGAGDGVVDADTQQPTQVESSNNIVLLVAALGVLIGVLIVAHPRRGPKLSAP